MSEWSRERCDGLVVQRGGFDGEGFDLERVVLGKLCVASLDARRSMSLIWIFNLLAVLLIDLITDDA